MNYPLISEYVKAIVYAEDNFSTLTNLRPVMENGKPFMSSGNFAVVFKMKDVVTGKLYAVKCFTRDEEQRERSYRLISDELNGVDSPYLTSIKYLEKELFVDTGNNTESEFPILLMDWVEGQTMDAYIRENINDKWELERLYRNFCHMGAWLLEQPFAHGDLKPENIMVSDGAMPLLVDYDGMYVPAMKGEGARELGSPDYRHPLRTEKDFDEHIDDFPLASIALSLKAISLDPSLLTRYGAADRLLFSATDYTDLGKCEVLKEITSLCSDSELQKLHSIFLLASSQKSLPSSMSQMFIPTDSENIEETLSTEVTYEDLAEAWEDEYGVLYSKDRKRLLKCKNKNIIEYVVREETRVICSFAFSECHSLASIILPDSLKSIGTRAFHWCSYLASIKLPNSLTTIGDYAFKDCGLTSIELPENLTTIGDYAFSSCSNLSSAILPDSLTIIGARAFSNCFYLRSVTLPKNLREIKENPFAEIKVQISNRSPYLKIENDLLIQNETVICASGNPETIIIPDYITNIGDSAFVWRANLVSVVLPNSLTSIGDYAFSECRNLSSIELPKNLTSIGNGAFHKCHNLSSIELPDSLTKIGEGAFSECSKLASVVLPNGLTSIRNNTFSACEYLASIILPNNLTSIGDRAFENCYHLVSVVLPDTLSCIGNSAFSECVYLTSVVLPNNLTTIGDHTFYGCLLTSIELPDSLTTIGVGAFEDCHNLASVVLPDNLTSMEDGAFSRCEKLTSITLPKNLQHIKGNPFTYCNVKISSKSPYFVIENDLLIQSKAVICVSGNPKAIIIPDYITQIGDRAFDGCENLTSIKFPNNLISIGDSSFQGCSNLTSIDLPDNLISIGDCAFSHCENLVSINPPYSLTSIGDFAFSDCEKLIEIELPDKLSTIGNGTFDGCKELTSITLHNSLTSVARWAFSECENLEKIYITCAQNTDKTSVLEKFKKQLPKELWDKIEIVEKK